MSIAQEIQRLQSAKQNIKSAIENKGVSVSSSATLDEYAICINAIQTTPSTATLTVTNNTSYTVPEAGIRFATYMNGEYGAQVAYLYAQGVTPPYQSTGYIYPQTIAFDDDYYVYDISANADVASISFVSPNPPLSLRIIGANPSVTINARYRCFDVYEPTGTHRGWATYPCQEVSETWTQWLSTSFNTYGFYASNGRVYTSSDKLLTLNTVAVQDTDYISFVTESIAGQYIAER